MSTPTTPKIMLIRHAEKPGDPPPPHGVDPDGEKDKESLIVLGWQRAGALAPFFAPAVGPLQSPLLATPAHLYASDPGNGSKSQRPEQTITPLAQRLGVQVDLEFGEGEETALAAAITALDGVVLVAWQHQAIPAIANAIVGDDTTVPQKWPGDRFDVVWVFDLDASTGSYAFSQVPQRLLAGDSDSVIS